ncbi:hypothetical protein JCM11641_001687 [Rhodosporidiobolus odoratus]
MAKAKSSASSATRKKHAAKQAKRQGGDDQDQQQAALEAASKTTGPAQRGQKKANKKEKRDRFAPKIKSYTPPPPPPKGAPDPVDVYIIGAGKGSVVDPELVVVLRRLHKKDEATVAKGVEGLEQWVKETVRMSDEGEGQDWEREMREEGVVEAMAVWAHHFPRLSLHPSRRLRLSVHALHSVLLGASSSRTATPAALFTQTRSALLAPVWVEQAHYVGAWAVSAWDTDRGVRREAKRGWDSVQLPPPTFAGAIDGKSAGAEEQQPAEGEQEEEEGEREGIDLTEQAESIAGFALSLVLSSSPSPTTSGTDTPTLEPEDPSFLSTSALLTLAHLLRTLPTPLPLSEGIIETLLGDELWSLVERAEGDVRRLGVKHAEQPEMVRRAVYEMLEALVGRREEEILILPAVIVKAGDVQGEEEEGTEGEEEEDSDRERRLRTVAVKVLANCWSEEEGWAGVIAFLRRYPQAWTLADSVLASSFSSTPAPPTSDDDDQVESETDQIAPSPSPSPALSLLLTHLRTSCSLHPSLYPTILLLLSTLPSSILPPTPSALGDLFEAFWAAKDSRGLTAAVGGKSGVNGWIAGLLECVGFEAFKFEGQGEGERKDFLVEWVARRVWKSYLGLGQEEGAEVKILVGLTKLPLEVDQLISRLAVKDEMAFESVWAELRGAALSVFGLADGSGADGSLEALGGALGPLCASRQEKVKAGAEELARQSVEAASNELKGEQLVAERKEALLAFLGEVQGLESVSQDSTTRAHLDELSLTRLPPLISSSPAALRLLIVHLSSAKDETRDKIWSTLFTPAAPSPSTLLTLLDALPPTLASSLPSAQQDDYLTTLCASVLSSPPHYTPADLTLLQRVLADPAPLASSDSPRKILEAAAETLSETVADALRSSWSAPPDLDALVAPTALFAHACQTTPNSRLAVAPVELFDVAYLLPTIRLEDKGIYVPSEAVFAAEPAFHAVLKADRKRVVQQVQETVRERIVDAGCRASSVELVEAAAEAGLEGVELGLVLPEKAKIDQLFDEAVLSVPPPALAILDPLVPLSSSTSSSPSPLSAVKVDAASLTPLSRALVALLELSARDHSLLRQSSWSLPYLLILSQSASDQLASPSSPSHAHGNGGFFGPEVQDEVLKRVGEAAGGASSYMLSSLANGLGENVGWHAAAIARLRSVSPSISESPQTEEEDDAVLVTLVKLFTLAKDSKNTGRKAAAARAVRSVLGKVLRYAGDGGEEEGRAEAERWLALAGMLQTVPDLASAILLAVKPILLETPRFTRYQSELASLLSGLRPAQLEARAFPLLQQLLSTAPALDEPIIFLPQQRAMFLLRAVQQWIASDEGLPEEIQAGVMELMGRLAPIVQDLSGSHWESMFDLIESNLESADWAEPSALPTTYHSCKLLALIKELSTANAELRETAKKRVEACVEIVLEAFVSRPTFAGLDQPRAIVVETMAQLVKDLPPRLLNMEKSFDQLLRLLRDPSLAAQLSSYDLLRRIITQHVSNLVVEIELEAEQEQVVIEFPTELLNLLQEPLEEGDEAEKATSYLFTWMTTFAFFDNASPRIRSAYVEQLRNLDLVQTSLLPSLFNLLAINDRTRPFDLAPWSINDFHLEYFTPSPLTLPIFAAHVYHRALQVVPAVIRSYWTSLQNLALSRTIQSFTSRHFSPLLVANELASLRDPTASVGKQLRDNDDFSVKVAANGSEVKVVFVVDEESMEIGIRLPSEYPLAAVEVKDVRKVGVTDKQWRSWLLGMQQAAQGTNAVDSIVLFKRNVEAHFEGQEACAICYSTVSTIDRSLPTKSCKTCQNTFHAGCLYKARHARFAGRSFQLVFVAVTGTLPSVSLCASRLDVAITMPSNALLPYSLRHALQALPLPWWLRPSKLGGNRSLVLGLTLGVSLSLSLTGLALYALDAWKRSMARRAEKRTVEIRSDEVVPGIEALIGNTPLVRVNSLSDALGVEILGKCEYLNPFGSVKDRVSLQIIQQAEAEGLIHPHTGSCIFEGTSGSTGISIAGIARARGYSAHIILPDDVAKEKIQMLRILGAEVEPVRSVSIVDRRHYVNLARQRALEFGNDTLVSTTSASSPSRTPRSVSPDPDLQDGHPAPDLLVTSGPAPSPSTAATSRSTPPRDTDAYTDPPRGIFADQFENLSNLRAHEQGTAVEIWNQTAGMVDGFVSGAGTGGTIAGCGKVLKEKTEGRCVVVLADPQGSGLYHKIHDGVMYAETESEGKRRRYQVDTVVEGIGLNRITRNLAQALPLIDDAIRVTDAEAVAMARHVALHDGLFLGSSSAVNLVACVRLARKWGLKGRGRRVVTILCDSGARHVSRFWNDDYLKSIGISVSDSVDFLFSEAVDGLEEDERDE